ncbi:hypothetical protein Q9L42_013900 [Methylomarinum sp. Ch1-1]|uniref:Uncharacterized protein n=1 Tax=Methylomarinum roseum TaxID=3067653 RepID=A0AAU7NR46_9GAMM|nr:hypothetical protein [Methylomarinum sp. Ch1-1]MDP4520586.1 hypothetical protein [Methylomarinum sp. Ch1-1]
MNNSEAWSHYKDYVNDLNEFSRKLGFAGSAICWVLKDSNGNFPKYVLVALACFVFFFIADVLQKFIGALLHRWWIRKREVELWTEIQSIEGEYLKPGWLDKPPFTFFVLKIAFLLIAFVFLGVAVFLK